MTEAQWSGEDVLKFIELYRVRQHLWDSSHLDYRNKAKRKKSLLEIAGIMKTGMYEVERRIKNLQSQFLRERKKQFAYLGPESTPYVSRWFAFKPLMFLADKSYTPRIKKSPTRTPLSVVDVKVEPYLEPFEDEGEHEQTDDGSCPQDQDMLDPESSAGFSPASASAVEDISRVPFQSWQRSKVPKLHYNQPTGQYHNNYHIGEERDEYSLYGEQVAIKIRKLATPRARFVAQNMINQVLFDAEMGILDGELAESSNR